MNFAIIHGVYANPESNWFSWLKKALEQGGYEVIVPKMPTPVGQTLDAWLRVFLEVENKINEETVLIGHSLGAAFILSWLEQTQKKVKAAYLVAGFFQLLNSPYDEINKTFVEKQFNWEKIKSNCGKFFVIASDNDQYISLDISRQLSENVNGLLEIVHDGGHLNKEAGYEEFPLLFDSILIELD